MMDRVGLEKASVRRARSSTTGRGGAAAAAGLALLMIGALVLSGAPRPAAAAAPAGEPARSADAIGAIGAIEASEAIGTPERAPILLAQDGGTEPRELEPAYAPPAPGKPGPYNEAEGPGYNSDYLFGITRATVRSTIVPAAKVPLFLLTVPLDLALLPFAAIGGFFG